MTPLLVANLAAFGGLTVALVVVVVRGNDALDMRAEDGRSWACGLAGMWLAAIVGLLRRVHSGYADTAALTAWTVWTVLAWWRVHAYLTRNRH